jgi:steroid delta-isomerase-like uncharacterized protein
MGPSEIHRRLHELFNNRDFDGLDEFMRADLTYEDVPQGRTVKSRDEFKDFLSEWTSAISDIRIRIDDGSYLEGPGFSLAMVRGGGRNDGAFGSIPATGRQVEFPSWEVYRFDGEDKVTSGLLHYDQLTLLTQLGQVRPSS